MEKMNWNEIKNYIENEKEEFFLHVEFEENNKIDEEVNVNE